MRSLEDTVRLYPTLRATSDFLSWLPVFFLYLASHWSLDQVLVLSAIYYATVFILEVPSGMLSDRIGRRATLLCGAVCAVLASALFVIGGSWWVFVAANAALAASIAMQSGSNTALHYDALKALGRESEYREREARAESTGMVSLASACLIGGLLGAVDFRLAYALAGISAVCSLVVLARMVEPPTGEREPTAVFTPLLESVSRLRNAFLAWLFAALIGLYALSHIVYELYQPFTDSALDSLGVTAVPAPLLSGIVIGVSMFGGALAARCSVSWQARIGLFGLFGVATLMQSSIVLTLAIGSGVLGLALATLRNFPMSLLHAPTNDAIAPHIESHQRATFLSLLSLLERLVFSALLFGLTSVLGDNESATADAVQPLLFTTLALVALVAAVLVITLPIARRALGGADP